MRNIKEIICPVCQKELSVFQNSLKCQNNHSFDISKYSTINLSLNNKSSKKRHGDDKKMVVARKEFLDKGYYSSVLDSVVTLAKKHCNKNGVLLDAGCGEGYYTSKIAQAIDASLIIGIDISKDALRWFKKRIENSFAIVCSIFKMPIKENSVDLAVNMFAPNPYDEFLRVIKKDGYLIRTFVLKNHLFELKQAVYDNAYYNDEEDINIDGFQVVETVKTVEKITVKGQDIENLFLMTPYYYKTSKQDQEKLKNLDSLETTIEVMSAIYKKL